MGIWRKSINLVVNYLSDYFNSLKRSLKAFILIKEGENLECINIRKMKMLVRSKTEHLESPKGWIYLPVTIKAGTKCYLYEDQSCIVVFTRANLKKKKGLFGSKEKYIIK